MADPRQRPPAHGDEAELFRSYNDELMLRVAGNVRGAPKEVIEDACSFAWTAFLEYQPERERNWRGWMFRTAQRQAWELLRRARDRGADELLPYEDNLATTTNPVDEIEQRSDVREALSVLAELPPRLQRIAVLKAIGLKQREISEITGDSPTRVGRLLVNAHDRVHDILAERAHDREPFSPRAERLWDLEHRPPDWLIAKIGRPLKPRRKMAGETVRLRLWRRAALALDDYREIAGPAAFESITAEAPSDPALRAQHARATKLLEAFRAETKRDRGCSRTH